MESSLQRLVIEGTQPSTTNTDVTAEEYKERYVQVCFNDFESETADGRGVPQAMSLKLLGFVAGPSCKSGTGC